VITRAVSRRALALGASVEVAWAVQGCLPSAPEFRLDNSKHHQPRPKQSRPTLKHQQHALISPRAAHSRQKHRHSYPFTIYTTRDSLTDP